LSSTASPIGLNGGVAANEQPELVAARKWLEPTPFVRRFFLTDRTRACYGFYSPAVDRFILVDSRDLFLSLKAATFFASKMLLLVAAFDPPEQTVDNSNCYLWAPEKRILQSAFHVPQILPNIGRRNIVYRGPTPHVAQADILNVQEHLGFVVQACYALYITEALDNVNAAETYEEFFPEFAPHSDLDRRSFKRIEQVLYRFGAIDEAMREIDGILGERLDLRHRQNYYSRFNRLFYARKDPPFKDA
jgi:hypothetical protein